MRIPDVMSISTRILPALFAVLVLGFALAGCQALKKGGADGNAASLEKQGDAALAEGRPDAAAGYYEQAQRAGMDKARATLKRGRALIGAGQWEAAVAALAQAQAAAPKNSEPPLLAGYAALRMNKPQEAEFLLRKSLELKSDSALAHSLLGVALNRVGKPEAALEEFDRSLAISGPEASVLNNQGLTLYMLERFASAEQAFAQAVSLDPQPRYRNNQALALCRMKRFNEAFDQFKQAEGEAAAHNNVGCCYLDDNQMQQAQTHFEKAIALSPTFYKPAAENLRRMGKTPPPPPGAAADPAAGTSPRPMIHESNLNAELAAQPARKPSDTPAPAPAPLSGAPMTTSAAPAASGAQGQLVLSSQSVRPTVQNISPLPAPQGQPGAQGQIIQGQSFPGQGTQGQIMQAQPGQVLVAPGLTPSQAPGQIPGQAPGQAGLQPGQVSPPLPQGAQTVTNVTGVDSGTEFRLLVSSNPPVAPTAASVRQDGTALVLTIAGTWAFRGQVVNYGAGGLVERITTEETPQGLRIRLELRKDAPRPASAPEIEPLPQGLGLVIRK